MKKNKASSWPDQARILNEGFLNRNGHLWIWNGSFRGLDDWFLKPPHAILTGNSSFCSLYDPFRILYDGLWKPPPAFMAGNGLFWMQNDCIMVETVLNFR